MLVRILKLFGFDLPAKMAEVRVGFEERLELAKDQVSQTAQAVAVLTALFALAAIALLSAFAVGLIALYSWVALNYGQFYGFAAVGFSLTLIAVVLFSAGMSKAKSRAAEGAAQAAATKIRLAQAHVERVDTAAAEIEQRVLVAPPAQPLSSTFFSDLVEPLTPILSRMIKFPKFGNPVLDELLVHLRGSARGVGDEALRGVTHAVRYGARPHMLAVLGGAVLVGWMLARHHEPEADIL
jgi:hypothetical protein